MTLQEIMNSDQVFLKVSDISTILRCDPQCIRVQAQRDATKLGFPVIVQGVRVRIPRIPFLKFLGVL